jgi:catechol 2,3-dioxygenase-like lactoylglutathione lyase family enzyme
MVPDEIRKKLKLPKLGQLGYVVADVDKTVAFYKETFGLGPWMVKEQKAEPCIEKGNLIAPTLKIALAYLGDVQIELIEVVKGHSYHQDHLKSETGGVHHLGFMVQDVEKRVEACKKIGIEVLQSGTIKDIGVRVDYAYMDTIKQAGVVIEFIRWRVGPLPLPVGRIPFNAICYIGAKTRLKGQFK